MKNNTFNLIRLVIIALFSLNAGVMLAQSTKIGVQGTVRKSDGNSLEDGSYDMTFRLYDAATGGTVLWSEEQTQVEVAGGIYSTQLGNVNALSLPFDADYFLSVQIEAAPEMTPRQQLTVAPYALSFKGSGNVFPSSGVIGIGTTSPTSGHNLHIKNGSGEAKQMIEGSSGAVIEMKKGSVTASIGYAPSSSVLEIKGTNNTAFQVAGSDRMVVTSTGLSVTGTGTFSNGLTVSSGTSQFNNITFSGNSISCSADLNIRHNGVTKLSITTTDVTMPTHLVVTGTGATYTSASSLAYYANDGMEILQGLQVANYRHRDFISRGTDFKKGFIAQEVETVFPEAVTVTTSFLPDVYQYSVSSVVEGARLTVALAENHQLVKGDKVQVIFPGGQKECMVGPVTNSRQLTLVDWGNETPEWLFVYGKQVDDFHQVDYDRIHTLNVSVTQELIRSMEALESELTGLRNENIKLKERRDQLDARVSKLEAAVSN
ncbi:MAG: tail fiber domain-containing protein [Saprospiraceae bacterium]|nr:tail fiber domain-containing protein [Saprospiraceae bacterium]